jgi:Smg protein
MLEILIYLFENYPQVELAPDRDALALKLMAAGFNGDEIDHALDWFSDLSTLNGATYPDSMLSSGATRFYAGEEQAQLDTECQGLLMFLEQAGILNPLQREWVIDRVLALDEDEITPEKIKWIALMVLWSQNPNQDYLLLEDMLFNDGNTLPVH